MTMSPRSTTISFCLWLATLTVAVASDGDVAPLTSCTSPEEAASFYHRYHSPTICDKYQDFTATMQHERQEQFHRLKEAGLHPRVPDQQTVVCPVTSTALSSPDHVVGLKQVWVVQNTASVPVVLAWVDTASGQEFSAMDSTISPPQADPNAILPPGQDALVYAYESNVFHVREVLDDGSTSKEILLQHRVGLIPVGGQVENQNLQCEVVAVQEEVEALPWWGRCSTYYDQLAEASAVLSAKSKDVASTVTSYVATAAVFPMAILGAGLDAMRSLVYQPPKQTTTVWKPVDKEPLTADQTDRVPKFRRQQPVLVPKECNGLEIGFRNRSPCPLHASWVDLHSEETCAEKFRFHLGVESKNVTNFMWDWTSQTKFESTFLGHQYVFRLAADPSRIVDTVTLAPTQIVDCPHRKPQQQQTQHIASSATTVQEKEREPKKDAYDCPLGQACMDLQAEARRSSHAWDGVTNHHPKIEL